MKNIPNKRCSANISRLSAMSLSLTLVACGSDTSGSQPPSVTLPPSPVSSPTPTPTPAPTPVERAVIGATSEAVCRRAGQDDQSACYIIDGKQAWMYGVIGDSAFQAYEQLRRSHPDVEEIVLVDVPGSANDEENTRTGRALHSDRLNTRLLANSEIASGGVDFFLAGIRRSVETGARIGVHSWSDSSGTVPANLPRDHPAHRIYLDYYNAIGYQQGEEFYFFTLQAAPADQIHWMTPAEISRLQMAKE